MSVAGGLGLGKGEQPAIGFQMVAIDLVILDDDVEAVFHLGQQVGDRLAVEFGQMAEQAAIGRQVGGAFVRQAEYVAQDCAQGLVDLAAGGPGRVRRR